MPHQDIVQAMNNLPIFIQIDSLLPCVENAILAVPSRDGPPFRIIVLGYGIMRAFLYRRDIISKLVVPDINTQPALIIISAVLTPPIPGNSINLEAKASAGKIASAM